ncbi:hypothetical protein AVEN_225775-1, partial [Araneus ventricosus]
SEDSTHAFEVPHFDTDDDLDPEDLDIQRCIICGEIEKTFVILLNTVRDLTQHRSSSYPKEFVILPNTVRHLTQHLSSSHPRSSCPAPFVVFGISTVRHLSQHRSSALPSTRIVVALTLRFVVLPLLTFAPSCRHRSSP